MATVIGMRVIIQRPVSETELAALTEPGMAGVATAFGTGEPIETEDADSREPLFLTMESWAWANLPVSRQVEITKSKSSFIYES